MSYSDTRNIIQFYCQLTLANYWISQKHLYHENWECLSLAFCYSDGSLFFKFFFFLALAQHHRFTAQHEMTFNEENSTQCTKWTFIGKLLATILLFGQCTNTKHFLAVPRVRKTKSHQLFGVASHFSLKCLMTKWRRGIFFRRLGQLLGSLIPAHKTR